MAFDLGKVLFDFDYNIALEKIKDKIGASKEEVIRALFYEDFARDFEKGLISGYDFYLKFKKAFKSNLEYEEFIEVWCGIFSPNEKLIKLVDKLRILYPVYLISNINELHFEYIFREFGEVFSLFDDIILSFKAKSVKPEKRIYEILIEKTGFNCRDIIYIEDREDLIEEAKKFQFRCIRFTNVEKLIEDLGKENIYILNEDERSSLLHLKDKLSTSDYPLILGMGNPLRGDDAIGCLLAEELKGKISIDTLNVERGLENYLGKIKNYNFLVIVDAAHFSQDIRFKVLALNELENSSLNFTHDLPLNLLTQYLKENGFGDILILAVKAFNLKFNTPMAGKVREAKEVLGNFFIRNFSNNLSLGK